MKRYKGLFTLSAMLVVAPLVVYHVAIADTLRLNRELRHTQKEIARLGSSRTSLPIVDSHTADDYLELQNGSVIASLMECEAGGRCSVVSFTPYVIRSDGEFSVHTAELILSGPYADLVRIIERTERKTPSCRLISATFRSVRQRKNMPTQLLLTLILQQIN